MKDSDSPSGAIAATIARSHRILATDTWNGFRRTRFEFGGREASVVEPSVAAPEGRLWTWTMQWWDAFVERTGVPDLLARGFHHVWIDLFGTRFDDGGVAEAAAFQRFLVDELGFAPQARLIGMSWGGFASVRYASAHPRNVRCIYLDAPLLNFDGFAALGAASTPTEAAAKIGPWAASPPGGGGWSADPRMPVNRAEPIARAGIPVLLLYGGQDQTVPPRFNCEPFAARFRAAGGTIAVDGRGLYGHHPHGMDDPGAKGGIVDFLLGAGPAADGAGPAADGGGAFPVSANVRGHENVEWSVAYAYGLTDATRGLPRALLVGDSICKGYEAGVRERLQGRMNVSFWASSYCVTSPAYLRLLSVVLDEAACDVVHFNNGLHSLGTPTGAYAEGVRAALALVRRKRPDAKIVWCSSTPLADAARTAKCRELNAAAARVAAESGAVATDDLFALCDAFDRESAWTDGVHFRKPVIDRQSEQVAESCLAALRSGTGD